MIVLKQACDKSITRILNRPAKSNLLDYHPVYQPTETHRAWASPAVRWSRTEKSSDRHHEPGPDASPQVLASAARRLVDVEGSGDYHRLQQHASVEVCSRR